MPEPDNTTRVRLDLPDEDHDELRMLAARSKMSMAEYCRLVVLESIRKGRVIRPERKEK